MGQGSQGKKHFGSVQTRPEAALVSFTEGCKGFFCFLKRVVQVFPMQLGCFFARQPARQPHAQSFK